MLTQHIHINIYTYIYTASNAYNSQKRKKFNAPICMLPYGHNIRTGSVSSLQHKLTGAIVNTSKIQSQCTIMWLSCIVIYSFLLYKNLSKVYYARINHTHTHTYQYKKRIKYACAEFKKFSETAWRQLRFTHTDNT